MQRQVGQSEAGARLDLTLSRWLEESRSRSQKRIDAGQVTVDGAVVAKSTIVGSGQTVVVTPPPAPVSPDPPTVNVRFRDDDLAVVVKPPGLVVHAGAGVAGPTLVDALQAQGLALAPGQDPRRPGIAHRLDRGTSGLLVVALSDTALGGLRRLFAAHDVHREYWALVEGTPDPPAATIDAPIVRSSRNRTTFTTGDRGRAAQTHYTTMAVHRQTAEVILTLETGRTHQVRVHLRAIGRPVAGDLAYGASAVLASDLGLGRQALHARRLAFVHPVTGAKIDLSADLPDDLANARQRASI
ncbi:RluA family pseudouridine synthase [soil metagenome]